MIRGIFTRGAGKVRVVPASSPYRDFGFDPAHSVRYRGAWRRGIRSANYPYGELIADETVVVIGSRLRLDKGVVIERAETINVMGGRTNPAECGLRRLVFVGREGRVDRSFLGNADVVLASLAELGWPVS